MRLEFTTIFFLSIHAGKQSSLFLKISIKGVPGALSFSAYHSDFGQLCFSNLPELVLSLR